MLTPVLGWAQPVIVTQPVSQTVSLGASVTLSVTATSSATIGYQWQANNVAISGATSASLTFASATAGDAATYTVYVYDANGGVTSSPATLTVDAGPLIAGNLSVTAYAYTFPFFYAINATNNPTSYSASGLPPGLTLDPVSGFISGTPTSVGTFSASITASNATGTNTQTLVFTITPPPYVPVNAGLPVSGVTFSALAGIARSPGGTYYVSDSVKNAIYAIDPTTGAGRLLAGTEGTAGSADGSGSAAQFNGPTGLATDANGNVYVADTVNSTVRMITPSGTVTTLAGTAGEPGVENGTGSAAHFNYPTSVAADASGNVYVADSKNNLIRKIAPGGAVTTLAGGGTGPLDSDGQGTSASFAQPQTMVIDGNGNLYVTDGYVNGDVQIRKVTATGVVTTLPMSDPILGGVSGASLGIDASGNLYLIDTVLSVGDPLDLVEFTPAGGEFQLGIVNFTYNGAPSAIAVDPSGSIYELMGRSIDVLAVSQGPSISMQPQSVAATAGQVVPLDVTAAANPEEVDYNFDDGIPKTMRFQLYFNDTPTESVATMGSFTVAASAATAGTYSILVTGPIGGSVMSAPVTLTIAPAVSLTTQPSDASAAPGGPAAFSVVATGGTSQSYQWLYDGAPISGATGASYSIAAVQPSNSGAYSVQVSSGSETVTSQAAFLTVQAATGGPSITVQPQSLEIYAGQTVLLSAGVPSGSAQASDSGASPRAAAGTLFQWFYNGAPLADGGGVTGSASSTLVLSGSAAAAGNYACLLTNAAGSVLSQTAVLTQSAATAQGYLTNVSCRAPVGTGADILIAGFTVAGNPSGGDEVLVRASGPALTPFNVTGVLPDPELQLYNLSSGSSLLTTNTSWAGSPIVSVAAAAVGAFAWTDPASHDAALIKTLPPGAYTANISGQSGDIGVALAEIYDTTPASSMGPGVPHLVNISARVHVGTGGEVLIAGFVVGGSTSQTLLIRGSGPALSAFGVPGVLPDPALQLFRENTDGTSTLVAANTGWGGSVTIASTAQVVGAFSWGASATPDSAILTTLPPGAYTVEVSGASGDTGVALVEVYAVP